MIVDLHGSILWFNYDDNGGISWMSWQARHFRAPYIFFSVVSHGTPKVVNFKSRKKLKLPLQWCWKVVKLDLRYYSERLSCCCPFFFFLVCHATAGCLLLRKDESIHRVRFVCHLNMPTNNNTEQGLVRSCYCALDSCLHNRQRTQLWKKQSPQPGIDSQKYVNAHCPGARLFVASACPATSRS